MATYTEYLNALQNPFIKTCRLRFLQPDGSTAFAVDNNFLNKRNKTFIASGSLTVNLQNGQRRSAGITLDNVNSDFDYSVNKLWFGTEIALDEGLVLPDGDVYYIQQGVFLLDNPQETIAPSGRTMNYSLVDKWANLDGRMYGYLDSSYLVQEGTNIFTAISSILSLSKHNQRVVDAVHPIFTTYYNNKTIVLADGTTAYYTDAPYDLTVEAGNTFADVITGLCEMLAAWVGYDSTGALRVDASQDDIADSTKPIAWTFSQDKTQLLGLSYSIRNEEVFNDIQIVGDQLDDYTQPVARARNYDPRSDTNINIIGRKTLREEKSGFSTQTQCVDYAVWRLKRVTALQKSVQISCSQILHIQENQLVEIIRTDKPGSPSERHLIQGFSRPLTGTGTMTIDAVSVDDFPDITVTTISHD